MSKGPNQRHMERVARCGCAICIYKDYIEPFTVQSLVHHLEEETGAAQRQDDFITIGACQEHHVGETGIHTLKKEGLEREYGVSELDLLGMIYKLIYPKSGGMTHMDRVAACGCAVCLHMGMIEPYKVPSGSIRLDEEISSVEMPHDWLALGICDEHRDGEGGLVTLKKDGIYRRYGVSCIDLLAMQNKLVYGPIKKVA